MGERRSPGGPYPGNPSGEVGRRDLSAVEVTVDSVTSAHFTIVLARLPELFPFRVTLTVDDVRRSPRFEVHRQGSGWEMVGLRA